MSCRTRGKVRIGLIGVGAIGVAHAAYLRAGCISGCELTAVCDAVPNRLAQYSDAKAFTDYQSLIQSGEVDAVLIATPHSSHADIAICALDQGLHVLVEKPIAVHISDCERMISAHRNPEQVFAAVFCQRTLPQYARLKQLLENDEIGEIIRVNWIVTDCFRTDAYYSSSTWRGTWRGDGGGLMMNQCPHHLDLLQWFVGMPSRVRGFCGLGVHHDIEVEDQLTAYLEYPNGATGVFAASTGEAPGTNRLEIAGRRGRVVAEDGRITLIQNQVPSNEFCKSSTEPFAKPAVRGVDVAVSGEVEQLQAITQNFVDAILDGAPLIASAEEGINSVQLANAILHSSIKSITVELPLDGREFKATLDELTAEGRPI